MSANHLVLEHDHKIHVEYTPALGPPRWARVTPLTLDVTSAAQTQAAAGRVESLDLLINNAGVALYDDLSDRAALEQQMAVNLFGTYGVTQAFLPLLIRSRGAIVNNLSLNAFAPMPVIPAYSISKAAAFSLTQSLRALLAGRGVRVHAVLTGPTDTDMTRGLAQRCGEGARAPALGARSGRARQVMSTEPSSTNLDAPDQSGTRTVPE